jgi:photosystem II stability/assembly factor-like uncharacterized protein
MTRVQQRLILFVLLVLLAAWVGVNWGKRTARSVDDAFLGYLKSDPEFSPPAYPLTSYPTNGPFGVGVVSAIAAGKGEVLYIGTYGGGLLKSENGGESWRRSIKGLGDEFIVSLAVTGDGTVYAGTIRAGLYKSGDQGESWTGINEGLGFSEVRTILPLSSKEIYVGTERGVYRSLDGGGHWDSIHKGVPPVLVRSILNGPDHTLYIGTQGLGIFTTQDPAEGWRSVDEDFFFEPGFRERIVRALVRDRRGALFAGTLGSGIFRSRDGGKSWLKANEGLDNLSIRAMAVSPEGVLYAGTGRGVYESRDGGLRWNPVNPETMAQPVEAMALAEKGRLYVGTGSGLYLWRSEKEGWISLSDSLLVPPVRDLEIDSKGTLYAVAEGRGVVKSEDGGKSWVTQGEGLRNASPLAIAPGGEGLYLVAREGLFGKNPKEPWRPIGGKGLPRVLTVGFAESVIYAGTDGGLYQSRDEGGHWEPDPTAGNGPIRQIGQRGGKIYLLSKEDLQVGSPKGGWRKIPPPASDSPVHFAVGPNGDLAVATPKTVYFREGESWREIGQGLSAKGPLHTVLFDPSISDVLFVGGDQGLFWTADRGRQWNPAHKIAGPFFRDPVHAIVIHPSGVLFTGTETEGVQVVFDRIERPGWVKRFFRG